MSNPKPPATGAAEGDRDTQINKAGYTRQFDRTIGKFGSFAISFSQISITTGLFSTFGVVLGYGGPAGIWTWPIVTIGTILVALVYGMLASRVPLSGFSYQWASRLVTPKLGWWYGWIGFAFLTLTTVSVDYALSQVALFPLFGWTYTPLSGAICTSVLMLVQLALIIWSTPILTRINNMAVWAELVGTIGLILLIFGAVIFAHKGDWSNLTSTGIIPTGGYSAWLGPFMLSALLGAYTLVGWESAANLTEETHNPKQVVPRAMVRALIISGVVGMFFLMALSVGIGKNVEAITASNFAVADIITQTVGPVVTHIMLVVVCIAIFACGLVIMTSNGRLVHAMARDGRIPFAETFAKVPRPTGGPVWAAVLVAAVSIGVVATFGANDNALQNVLAAGTLVPAIAYAATVALYLATRRGYKRKPDDFNLGIWEWPVVIGACIWLIVELCIFMIPAEFRTAQLYAAGALVLGGIIYFIVWLRRREYLGRMPSMEVDDL
ncbi:MAG: amino acid permease [Propionibacteriaceae bacterium]|nr:amino acid permease [Propionibacteriaceae bacterium]